MLGFLQFAEKNFLSDFIQKGGCMKRIVLIGLATMILSGSMATTVGAQNLPIFSDHFDDGIIDPNWEVLFESLDGIAITTGGVFDESITQPSDFTVHDITVATSGTSDFPTISLNRTIPALGDFHITMNISWSSEGPSGESPIQAIHALLASMLDGTGSTLFKRAGFADPWNNDTGTRTMQIPPCCGVPSSLPASGSAQVELDRTGNTLNFVWDGATAFTTPIGTQPAKKIKLRFERWDGPSGVPHHMGTLAIDQITVEGTPVAPVLACVGFDPPAHQPISVKKPNRVLALRMVLQDSSGQDITNIDLQNPPILEVNFLGTPSEAEPPTEIISAGPGDDGNQFVFTGGQWQYRLSLKNFSGPGIYEAKVISGDLNEYFIAQPTCTATFTIANN